MLYNEPDFHNNESKLKITACKLGSQVIDLPKFHPELNPMEPTPKPNTPAVIQN
ncbi:hypothetical protein GYMLUDRAFT_176639 [Collybiopsis luxurians FD-317 M1]|uniref:Uncharacterized protein n=1 Tax=Collybiopsis luxurians FD-317 M1 TaxID=944289 RepID=A0A0D0BYB6_9AGAR|nr:hypothetical protein GYMLUDRAFT_176639 [Collybiopsis luxurians FD-317 M1]